MRDEISARRACDFILDNIERPEWELPPLTIEPCDDRLIRRLLDIVDENRLELRRVDAPLRVNCRADGLDKVAVFDPVPFGPGKRVTHRANCVERNLVGDGDRPFLGFRVELREVPRKHWRLGPKDARCSSGVGRVGACVGDRHGYFNQTHVGT